MLTGPFSLFFDGRFFSSAIGASLACRPALRLVRPTRPCLATLCYQHIRATQGLSPGNDRVCSMTSTYGSTTTTPAAGWLVAFGDHAIGAYLLFLQASAILALLYLQTRGEAVKEQVCEEW